MRLIDATDIKKILERRGGTVYRRALVGVKVHSASPSRAARPDGGERARMLEASGDSVNGFLPQSSVPVSGP